MGLWLIGCSRMCLVASRLRRWRMRVRGLGFVVLESRLLLTGLLLGVPRPPTRGGRRAVPKRLLLLLLRGGRGRLLLARGFLGRTPFLIGGVTRRLARGLLGNVCCDHPLGLAAQSGAQHHRSEHESEGERHHDHPHLHKKRDFPEHPPAFPRRVCRALAPEHERQPYGSPAEEQRQHGESWQESGEAAGVW